MAEIAYPVVNEKMNEAQWATIARAFGSGVLDRGGSPYLMTSRDSVTDEVVISVDKYTGRNEAILNGFIHSIDTVKRIKIPPVATTTTYEVGLSYDPTRHGTGTPVVLLEAWTVPADYTLGKARVVLYEIVRAPNQSLANAKVTENRPRVSPQITVSNTAYLPDAQTVLVDTAARVRSTGTEWRATIAADGSVKWVEGDNNSAVNAATPFPTGGTLMRRFDSGVVRVADSIAHPQDALNVGTADSRFHRLGGSMDAGYLQSGIVPYERVGGSTWAYDRVNPGGTFTMVVSSSGRFYRNTSAKKYKRDYRPWRADPRALLRIIPTIYKRLNPETGTVSDQWEVGVLADDAVQHAPEFGEYAVDPDTGHKTVEGWSYQQWTAALQHLVRWLTGRVDGHEAEVAELKRDRDQARADLAFLAEHAGLTLPSTPQDGAQ